MASNSNEDHFVCKTQIHEQGMSASNSDGDLLIRPLDSDGTIQCARRLSPSDAHKLADWIKENIPETPPAPPEWRIVIGEERVALMIRLLSMGVIGSDGIVRDYGISGYDGVTPELHKEMICALLDAHYEMHKWDS